MLRFQHFKATEAIGLQSADAICQMWSRSVLMTESSRGRMQEKNRTKYMKENHPMREICSWRRSMQNWRRGTSERPPEFSVARIILSRRLPTPVQQCKKITHLTNAACRAYRAISGLREGSGRREEGWLRNAPTDTP